MAHHKTPSSFGPRQLAEHLGIPEWQFDRARRLDRVPAPDRARGRWSRATVEDIAPRLDEVVEAAGSVPDMGAVRAAEHLTQRLGMDVTPDAVAELARQGLLRTVEPYKGNNAYDGQDLEALTDRVAVERAGHDGEQLLRDEVAERLGVREVDVRHLVRAGLLTPVRWVRSWHQRRSAAPCVPLYRAADLTALQERHDINWSAVRATPRGQRSPPTSLPDAG
ncbi:hypothetical protein [Streptomyces sp. NBC_01187]|uniref:hypothetical protein n=1 Tax=Streptomyces sp. NBC_01187 TaxID=2903766 RepID=UPI00386D7520|nr:hypothetical protein OG220_00005 [Streptomyces sp. NBC_01187]WSS46034.1 hypothetical protein OG220_39635 [Streptomyces sp. NBC_01187]